MPTNPEMINTEANLQEMYSKAYRLMHDAENKPRGTERQDDYLKARLLFEQAAQLVEALSMFSDNETVDDIATPHLRYLLIPAHLAKIATSSECGPNRLEVFERAEKNLVEFLDRILKYGLGEGNIYQLVKQSSDDLAHATSFRSDNLGDAMRARNDKIQRYNQIKQLDNQIQEFEKRIATGESIDDETAREHQLTLLTKTIHDCAESLEREVRPALMFEKRRCDTNPSNDEPGGSKNRLRQKIQPPLTIVRNELQKQVFGLGYPSKPTVTVDEFITQKMNSGELAFQKHSEVYSNSLQRYAEQPNLRRDQEEASDEEREVKFERDDPEELERRRRWDEFKDENPRGSGNRHNMG